MSTASATSPRPAFVEPLDVVLCPVGTLGDMNPQLAIGAELRRRGHRITVMANERFADACQFAADEFVSVYDAQALDDLAAKDKSFTYNKGYELHTRTHTLGPMPPLCRALLERKTSRTVVVASNVGIGARVAQEVAGFPMLTAVTDPHFLRGKGVLRMPPPMIVGTWVLRSFMNFQWRVADRFFIDPLCCDEINAFRGQYGLKPIRRVMNRWWFSPDGVLALFPEWWGPRQPEWPPNTTTIGFPVYDRTEHESLPTDLLNFFAAGSPPVAYSPGHSHLHEPHHLAAVVAACRSLGRRVILITPQARHGFGPEHRDVFATRYVPFRQLLPRIVALVHHAGTGTTAAALRAGVPQVLVPTIFNQPDTAIRAERLGVGRTVSPEQFTSERLTQALRNLLEDPRTQYRCRETAARFGAENEPAQFGADCVERLAAARLSQAQG